MRQVLHQDIVALARCLGPVSKACRRKFALVQIGLAHAADLYRIRTGRAHPVYGNGTLMSCLAGLPRGDEATFDNLDFAECMVHALEAVIGFRKGLKR